MYVNYTVLSRTCIKQAKVSPSLPHVFMFKMLKITLCKILVNLQDQFKLANATKKFFLTRILKIFIFFSYLSYSNKFSRISSTD